jgi:hypothetical protein
LSIIKISETIGNMICDTWFDSRIHLLVINIVAKDLRNKEAIGNIIYDSWLDSRIQLPVLNVEAKYLTLLRQVSCRSWTNNMPFNLIMLTKIP